MKIECPSCQQPIEFVDDVGASKLKDRQAKIRRQAESFATTARVCVFISAAFMVLGIADMHQENATPVFWIIMGALWATAFWLYLVAQLIHIRANTER